MAKAIQLSDIETFLRIEEAGELLLRFAPVSKPITGDERSLSDLNLSIPLDDSMPNILLEERLDNEETNFYPVDREFRFTATRKMKVAGGVALVFFQSQFIPILGWNLDHLGTVLDLDVGDSFTMDFGNYPVLQKVWELNDESL